MPYVGGLLGLALFALWVYCILDVIATDEAVVRNMPKILWLIVVIIVPTVGAVAWLALGRPSNVGLRPGDTTPRQAPRAGPVFGPRYDLRSPRPPRSLGPEDSPEFMEGLEDRATRLRRWEEDLRRREEDLRRREREDPGEDGS